jgi:serine/threonine protein kinase
MEISDMARDLFEKMAERDPKQRINLSDIKDHPWIKSDILKE